MDIQEKTGTTFVIVTHDQEEAMTVASRVAVMDEGSIIQVDTPAGSTKRPNSVYVADFIGDVNIIEGTRHDRRRRLRRSTGPKASRRSRPTSDEPFSDGQTLPSGDPPRKGRDHRRQARGRANALQGKVLDIAYLGNMSTYHVELADGQIIKAQTANTRRLVAPQLHLGRHGLALLDRHRRRRCWRDEPCAASPLIAVPYLLAAGAVPGARS